MNNKIYQTKPYASPRIEMIEVEVEQGIAASVTIEDPIRDPEMGWDD